MTSIFVDSDSDADNKLRAKYKEIASTPKTSEHHTWRDDDSPSTDLAPSPIPFICTQDGQQGDIDVVWNYYSPKSKKHKTESETPMRKKRRKLAITDFSPIPKFPARKRTLNEKLKRQEFLKSLEEELTLFNKNVQKLISSKAAEKAQTTEELPISHNEDIFENSICEDVLPEIPTSIKKNLCKQILQRENSPIESDDSMNEYLLRASQAIEEKIVEPKLPTNNSTKPIQKPTPLMCNDSFDNIICMMNENDLEIISSQANKIHSKNVVNGDKNKNINSSTAVSAFKNISNNFNSSTDASKNKLARYNSMPVVKNNENVQKTSSVTLARHKTMPFPTSNPSPKKDDHMSRQGCSQEEIKRKREAAREKLLAKKRGQQNIDCNVKSSVNNLCINNNPVVHCPAKRVCLNSNEVVNKTPLNSFDSKQSQILKNNSKESDIKKEIERKRLQALQKLQKKKWLAVNR